VPFREAKLFLVPRPPAPEGEVVNEPKVCTVVKCPLCEGRGEMNDHELLTRLREKDVAAKMANYIENVVEAEEKTRMAEPRPNKTPADAQFQHDVKAWNCTHFLWRRSPKE
jgi:hypothetical protein